MSIIGTLRESVIAGVEPTSPEPTPCGPVCNLSCSYSILQRCARGHRLAGEDPPLRPPRPASGRCSPAWLDRSLVERGPCRWRSCLPRTSTGPAGRPGGPSPARCRRRGRPPRGADPGAAARSSPAPAQSEAGRPVWTPPGSGVTNRSMRIDPGATPRAEQGLLDQVHERAGAADVEVGLGLAADQVEDRPPAGETRWPSRSAGAPRADRGIGGSRSRRTWSKMTDSGSRLAYRRRTVPVGRGAARS